MLTVFLLHNVFVSPISHLVSPFIHKASYSCIYILFLVMTVKFSMSQPFYIKIVQKFINWSFWYTLFVSGLLTLYEIMFIISLCYDNIVISNLQIPKTETLSSDAINVKIK